MNETPTTTTVAYSKITNTPVPYKDRWTDSLYKKEYLRWWRHTVKGLKRRPTRNLDGTLYKDTHPECQFVDYYKNAGIWKCPVCEISMTDGMKQRHLNSKRHSNNIAKKQFLEQQQPTLFVPPPAPPLVLQTVNSILQTAQEASYFFSKN